MWISWSSISTTLKLDARPERIRFEMVPAVEMIRPWAPLSMVWMASWWSCPQRINSVPRSAKAWRACSVLARPWRPDSSPLMGLWCIITMRAEGAACSKISSSHASRRRV